MNNLHVEVPPRRIWNSPLFKPMIFLVMQCYYYIDSNEMNISGWKTHLDKLFSVKKLFLCLHHYCKSQQTLFSLHNLVLLRSKRPLCKHQHNLALHRENIKDGTVITMSIGFAAVPRLCNVLCTQIRHCSLELVSMRWLEFAIKQDPLKVKTKDKGTHKRHMKENITWVPHCSFYAIFLNQFE